ncbi:S-methyl-5'-thioadenosine phosphorylase [Methanobrevibacter filiformis]|uniref:Probable S-methyl-5'-thioinosine phosphorylase n=1 Tax=Methanobrevibacter filiformis TaxID=55758 RepID=A0A166E2D2_9EURY|nr:S-methyl-5'-thioadenosine phosphorylase [Methanobrevibacter filiformis]KZX16203.1 S-methyl-5'-thioadenosine phosphorylase [Methanobrevibacter filiformis]
MIGIIGGSGIYDITRNSENVENKSVNTPYGQVDITVFTIEDKNVAFLPRHATGHSTPPHMVNYRANVFALKKLGVNQIIATNAVGSVKKEIPPGSLVVCDDFLDFTSQRPKTFYDDKVVHVDVTEPYCNRLREVIISNGKVVPNGVYVCNEGPRFETPAEIKMLKVIGGDLVGMTGLPEAVLARELEMCYGSICIVSNYASSISEDNLTMDEVFEIMEVKKDEVIDIIYKTINSLSEKYDCPCLHALDGAES